MVEDLKNIQIRAVKGAWKLAERLQVDHPNIADMYRSGSSHVVIAQHFQIPERYNISLKIARTAVCAAIAGHKPGWDMDELEGLITDRDELDRICKAHNSATGIVMGHRTLRDKIGIYAMTPQQRRDLAKKTYASGKGLAAMSSLDRKMIGKRSSVTKGLTPWIERTDYYNFVDGEFVHNYTSLSEEDYLESLSKSSSYVFKSGIGIGKRDLQMIRKQLNKVYHQGMDVRSLMSIKRKLNKLRGGK